MSALVSFTSYVTMPLDFVFNSFTFWQFEVFAFVRSKKWDPATISKNSSEDFVLALKRRITGSMRLRLKTDFSLFSLLFQSLAFRISRRENNFRNGLTFRFGSFKSFFTGPKFFDLVLFLNFSLSVLIEKWWYVSEPDDNINKRTLLGLGPGQSIYALNVAELTNFGLSTN